LVRLLEREVGPAVLGLLLGEREPDRNQAVLFQLSDLARDDGRGPDQQLEALLVDAQEWRPGPFFVETST
jgi:hypothetical protein